MPLQSGQLRHFHKTSPGETAKSTTSRLESHLYTMYKWFGKISPRFELFSKLCSSPCRISHLINDVETNSTGASGRVEAGSDSGPVHQAHQRLEALRQQINRLQRAVRLAIEGELAAWSGQTYGSLAANQEVVRMIQEIVDAHGLRLRCPECGHPAILRCSSRPAIPDGVFVFDHQIDGRRTFHGGGVVLPVIRLVAKPARRRKAQED